MDRQINVSVIADKRLICEKFGILLGKRIFKVAKVNVKLDYFENKRKIEECNGITTNRPIVRYMIVPIDITSVEVDRDLDGAYEVILNRGLENAEGEKIEIHCPFDNPILTRKMTTEVLSDALNDKMKANTFFSSVDAVRSEINRLNEKERNRAKAHVDDVLKQIQTIDDTITLNDTMASEYNRQLAVGDTDQKDIHISIEA